MRFFKVFLCIFMLFFSYIFPVFADDEFVESEFDISSVSSSSSPFGSEPIINSRTAIVLDRTSKLFYTEKTKTKKEKWHLPQKL